MGEIESLQMIFSNLMWALIHLTLQGICISLTLQFDGHDFDVKLYLSNLGRDVYLFDLASAILWDMTKTSYMLMGEFFFFFDIIYSRLALIM